MSTGLGARRLAAHRRRGEEEIQRLRGARDPWDRVLLATELLTLLNEEQRAISLVRDETILELRAAGSSYGDIARATGLTRARIAQIVRRTSPAES